MAIYMLYKGIARDLDSFVVSGFVFFVLFELSILLKVSLLRAWILDHYFDMFRIADSALLFVVQQKSGFFLLWSVWLVLCYGFSRCSQCNLAGIIAFLVPCVIILCLSVLL